MSAAKRGIYVNYGCGFVAPPEWENFDASPTLRFERIPVLGRMCTKNSRRFPSNVRYGDIVKGLPIEKRSCQGIYASHVLEHLALDDFEAAIRNTARMLHPDGVFRLVVPDLEWCAREYITKLEIGDGEANSFFLSATLLGNRTRARGFLGFVQKWLGNAQHMWMWDAQSVMAALRRHGFTTMRRCAFGDSADPMFALVEDPDRFEHAAAIEARL
jgi:hypothetical protein